MKAPLQIYMAGACTCIVFLMTITTAVYPNTGNIVALLINVFALAINVFIVYYANR